LNKGRNRDHWGIGFALDLSRATLDLRRDYI